MDALGGWDALKGTAGHDKAELDTHYLFTKVSRFGCEMNCRCVGQTGKVSQRAFVTDILFVDEPLLPLVSPHIT